jgi:hypothetical protein
MAILMIHNSSFRPLRRWTDETVMTDGTNWMRTAQQRIEWNALGETFIQQWTENG